MMKALLIENERLHIRQVSKPEPKDKEILLRIKAAGVNRADVLQRKGGYPSPPGWPQWPGLEAAGIVEAVGPGVTAWKAGDRVCALLGGGGYAEYVCVPEGMVMPIPLGLSFEQAAALPEVCATAYLNLFLEGHLELGQTAFIPGGNSGLASIAIPMAKAFGARVITSVRTQRALDAILDLGADRIICSGQEDVVSALAQEEAKGTPVNVSMDCLCGETMGKSIPYMAKGGYWIVIATLAGTETVLPLRAVLTRGLHIVGSTLRSRTEAFKQELLQQLVQKVWPKIENGTIPVPKCKTLSLPQANEAHALLEKGGNVGKIVLTVEE